MIKNDPFTDQTQLLFARRASMGLTRAVGGRAVGPKRVVSVKRLGMNLSMRLAPVHAARRFNFRVCRMLGTRPFYSHNECVKFVYLSRNACWVYSIMSVFSLSFLLRTPQLPQCMLSLCTKPKEGPSKKECDPENRY